MRNACSKLPVATRLTQLAMALSAVFVFDHEALAGTVTVCDDTNAAGTLRKVVQAAASDETIDISACSLITLTQGQISSSLQRLRIQGSAISTSAISGGGVSRVLYHTGSGGFLLLRNVTIQDGNVTATNAIGGCIYSTEAVNFEQVTLKGCLAKETGASGVAKGGGVYGKGNVDLRNSIVTGNTATQVSTTAFHAQGGGIYAHSLSAYNSVISNNTVNYTGGFSNAGKYTFGGGARAVAGARLYSSTVNGNAAGKYGGVFGAGVNVVNSTISHNTAARRGGGVGTSGALVLANSTVAFNYSLQSNAPAGAYGGGVVTLQSSIVANNTFLGGAESDLQLGMSASFDPASANNIVMSSNVAPPVDTITLDPRLLPLADNGGSTAKHPVTRTHALSQSSPALNRGNITYNLPGFIPLTCDQRGNPTQAQSNPPSTDHCGTLNGGFLRVDSDPLHSLPDIGAYEEQLPNPDWIFYDGFGF